MTNTRSSKQYRVNRISVLLAVILCVPFFAFAQLNMPCGNMNMTQTGSSIIHQNACADGIAKFAMDNHSLFIKVKACNGLSDMAMIHINSNATCNFDINYDSLKQVTDGSAISLAIVGDDKQNYTVSSFSTLTSATVVPLSFECSGEGTCVLSVSGAASFDFRFPIVLKDKELGKIVELRNDSVYTFTKSVSTKADRFEIMFDYPSGMPLQLQAREPEIIVRHNGIIIKCDDLLNGEVAVYDLGGKLMNSGKGVLNSLHLNVNTKPGIYIVRLAYEGKYIVKKVYFSGNYLTNNTL